MSQQTDLNMLTDRLEKAQEDIARAAELPALLEAQLAQRQVEMRQLQLNGKPRPGPKSVSLQWAICRHLPPPQVVRESALQVPGPKKKQVSV